MILKISKEKKMKQCLVVLMLFACIGLSAIGEGAFSYLSFEPSSINRGMGEITGVVNIWHNNPFTAYANPAISSFHEGLAYSYSSEVWFDLGTAGKCEYNRALMTIAYNGLAVTLPGYNSDQLWGISLHNTYTFANLNIDEYPQMSVFGLAVNPCEIIRNNHPEAYPWLKYIDLAFGANYLPLKDDLTVVIYGQNIDDYQIEKVKPEANVLNIGEILKLNYCYQNKLALEAVYGLTHFNATAEDIKYREELEAEPIYAQRNQGFAISAAIKTDPIWGNTKLHNLGLFDNLLSFRYLNSALEPNYKNSEEITGNGIELGLLDTCYYRLGNYDDGAGEISGSTKGWGINLHYKDLISFGYNYAKTPAGGMVDNHKSEEYSCSFDFIGIYNQLTK